MAKDEEVDGAAIAARILSCMPRSDRQRILGEMQQTSPLSTTRVKESLIEIARIAEHNSPLPLPAPADEPGPQVDQIAAALKKLLATDAEDPSDSEEITPAPRRVTRRVEDLYPSAGSTRGRITTKG